MQKKSIKYTPSIITFYINLAAVFQASNKFDEAIILLNKTIQLIDEKKYPTHPTLATCFNNLADTYFMKESYEEVKFY